MHFRSNFIYNCFEAGCFADYNGLRPEDDDVVSVQGLVEALGDAPAHKRAVLDFARKYGHLLR